MKPKKFSQNQNKKDIFIPTKEEKESFLKEIHNKLTNVGGFKHHGNYYMKHIANPLKKTISVYIKSDYFEILVDEGGREGWFTQKHSYHPSSMKRIDEIL